jgi:hypothetical protein
VAKVSIHRNRRQEQIISIILSALTVGQTVDHLINHRNVGQSIVWSSDVNLRPDYGIIIYIGLSSQVSCSLVVPSSLV